MKHTGQTPVLWVIDFKDNKPQGVKKTGQRRRFPKIEQFLPEINPKEPPPPDPIFGEDPETQQKALDFFNQIVEACKEIKGECAETLEHKDDDKYEEKISGVANNLKGLFNLLVQLTRLIKRNKPKEDNPPRP